MTLFEHDVAECDDFLVSFEFRQGDRAAELAWTMRDDQPREVRIYRSCDGFITDCGIVAADAVALARAFGRMPISP